LVGVRWFIVDKLSRVASGFNWEATIQLSEGLQHLDPATRGPEIERGKRFGLFNRAEYNQGIASEAGPLLYTYPLAQPSRRVGFQLREHFSDRPPLS
jgi:hypothetical protein